MKKKREQVDRINAYTTCVLSKALSKKDACFLIDTSSPCSETRGPNI